MTMNCALDVATGLTHVLARKIVVMEIGTMNMMMAPTMKINAARAIAKVLVILNRFKIISDMRCDRLIDELTVKVIKEELKNKNP